MATVAGPLRPDQPFASMLTAAFNQAPTFISQTKITVPSDDEKGMPEDVLKDKFILNDKCFVDLQVYLKSAMRLPTSNDDFKRVFPAEWFAEYFETDKAAPKLYDHMQSTLVGINNHCFEFWRDTMGPMVSLAGRIANFCDEAKELGDDLYKQLQVITRAGAKLTDEDVTKALKKAGSILKDLKTETVPRAKECEDYVKKLSAFQAITEADKNNIDNVATRTNAALPSNEKLNADLRQKMDAATVKMQKALDDAEKERKEIEANSGAKWYYFIAWPVTLGTWIMHDTKKSNALKALKTADKDYQDTLKDAGAKMSAIIGLRANCDNLKKMITDVQQAIKQAGAALEHMKNAFSRLQTDIEFITTRLDRIDDKMIDADADEREKSLKNFDGARWRWVLVKNLARGFQAKGLLMDAALKEAEVPPAPANQIDIRGAAYGGSVVTNTAQVLFNDGADLLIDSTKMAFIDNWRGTVKAVSMLYTYGQERRLFICQERSGEHRIPASSDIPQGGQRVHTVLTPRSKPNGALYQILAIVWGIEEKKDDKSYNYVYEQMAARRPVRWHNDNFPDGWNGKPKSGAIFYTTDGKDVKVLTGKEHESTAW